MELVTANYQDNQTGRNGTDVACSEYGRGEMHTKMFKENLKERNVFGGHRRRWQHIIKWM